MLKRKYLIGFLVLIIIACGFLGYRLLKIIIVKEKWIEIPISVSTDHVPSKIPEDSLYECYVSNLIRQDTLLKNTSEKHTFVQTSYYFNFKAESIDKIDFVKFQISYPQGFILTLNGEIICTSPNLNQTNRIKSLTFIMDHTLNIHPESFIVSGSNLKEGPNSAVITIFSEEPAQKNFSPIKNLAVYKNGIFFSGWNGLRKLNVSNQVVSELPSFYINTLGNEMDEDEKIKAQLTINTQVDKSAQNIKIEYHGKSSLWHSQLAKSYSFHTYDKNWKKSKFSLLNLPENSEWVLYAPYIDKSLIRNALTYTLAGQIQDSKANIRFCNVFVDKEYMGLYMLVEKPHLRDPEKSKDRTTTPPFLCEIDRPDPKYFGWYLQKKQSGFTYINILNPKLQNMDTIVAGNYIKTIIGNIDNSFRQFPLDHKRIDSLLNIESLINFMLLNELSKNPDAYGLSVYFSKPQHGQVVMGPIWDFDIAYGNLGDEYWNRTDSWCMELPAGTQFQRMEWIPSLLRDSIYFERVKDKWISLRKQELSNKSILQTIDQLVDQVKNSEVQYHQTIPILDKWVWPNAYLGDNYENEIYYLKCWILKRLIWMDEQFLQTKHSVNMQISKN